MREMTELCRKLMDEGKAEDCPVYDMHGHMGFWKGIYLPYPHPGEMVERMKMAGVKLLAFCHHSALFSPDIQNRKNIEEARKFPGFLRAYCGINPHYRDNIESDLEAYGQNEDVYIGLKILADYHKVAISDKRYEPALQFADSRGLPVLLHTWGGSVYDGEGEVRKVLERYKKAVFILGHSLHGAWDDAVSMAEHFPNAYLELCAVLDERSGILEMFVEKAGSEKILFGTDFPWFNHHYYIGAVVAADINDQDRRNIFYRNARAILNF